MPKWADYNDVSFFNKRTWLVEILYTYRVNASFITIGDSYRVATQDSTLSQRLIYYVSASNEVDAGRTAVENRRRLTAGTIFVCATPLRVVEIPRNLIGPRSTLVYDWEHLPELSNVDL